MSEQIAYPFISLILPNSRSSSKSIISSPVEITVNLIVLYTSISLTPKAAKTPIS
ncbi:hypothetical protein LEQ06_12760 [Paraclostridium sp. AKS46]|uniref:hypothetical protein n=1 Tax=Paraclostridium sp. AKS81 TaxID=2876117 RepID=UPI0021E02705|nr:hypothetical protein [Paraclostridium sp. AKS81]MCU9808953.1 hypothetical protein [Paraclostridium sp. AKS46]MCU9811857.1 hypothetical protein [Paraclostridium sp. AKS81]MDO7203278.1 hypothetical protein [Paraclostridium bifermentans]